MDFSGVGPFKVLNRDLARNEHIFFFILQPCNYAHPPFFVCVHVSVVGHRKLYCRSFFGSYTELFD